MRLEPTVTLEARGATFTQTVEVRGDPLLSITQAMYEECEVYLLELLALERRIGGEAVRPGSLHPPTPEHIRRKTAIEERLDRILPSTGADR